MSDKRCKSDMDLRLFRICESGVGSCLCRNQYSVNARVEAGMPDDKGIVTVVAVCYIIHR